VAGAVRIRITFASPMGQQAQVGDVLEVSERQARRLISFGVAEPVEGRIEDWCDPILRARTRASIERTYEEFLSRTKGKP